MRSLPNAMQALSMQNGLHETDWGYVYPHFLKTLHNDTSFLRIFQVS